MSLLSIIRKTKAKEKEVRVLTLQESSTILSGLDNAGKTTIILKFLGEDTSKICPTLGFNIKTFELEGLKLNMWDVGGQRTLRSYWRNYFEYTDGVIWVVDSGDKLRLLDCKSELHLLMGQEVNRTPTILQKLAGATLMVFCNKQDITGAMSPKEIAEILDLKSISNRHWAIFACSAITGEGLIEGLKWLAEDIKSRIFLTDQRILIKPTLILAYHHQILSLFRP